MSGSGITKRSLLTGGALLAGGALAAACEAREPAGPAGTTGRSGTLAPATLVFIDPDGQDLGETKAQAAAQFTQRYPSVKVERVFGEGSKSFDKIQTLLAGGTQLDVFWSWGYWKNAMAARGALVAFDEFLRREPKDSYVKTWSPGAQESTKFQGKSYGYVTLLGVPGLLVNEELFKQAGVPLPPKGYKDQTWTLARHLEVAQKLTRRGTDGRPEQYGSTPWGTWWAGLNWIAESFGSPTFNADWTECLLDRAEVIQAQQWAADLRLKHRVAPTTEENKDKAFDFPAGRVAIRLGWPHQPINTVKAVGDSFQWNFYPLPKGQRQTAAGAAFNWYCLLKDSKFQDQTLRFIHFMAGPEVVSRFYGNAASFPFVTAGQEHFLRDLPQLNKQVALEGMALVRSQPNLPRDPEIQQVVGKEVGPAFEGQRPMKDALVAAAQQIRLLLR